jgi:signal transduction histidine kinase
MLTVLSHELRTPVNIIQGAAEMLSEESLPASERGGIVNTLSRGVARLLALVSKLNQAALVTGEQIEAVVSDVRVSRAFLRKHSQAESSS